MPRGKKFQTSIQGFGFIYQPTYKYKGEIRKQSTWWMRYKTRDGKQAPPRNTQTKDQRKAFELLQLEHDRLRRGEIDCVSAEYATIGQLLDLMLGQYKGNATYVNQKNQVERHVRPEFGDTRAIELRKGMVAAWADKLEAGMADPKKPGKWLQRPLAPASVNRMLSSLHSALTVGAAEDPPLVLRIPEFPWRIEDNARQGVISRETYQAVRDLLPDHARLALVIGYHTGLRKGLILSLEWNWVDLQVGVIRIPEGGIGTGRKTGIGTANKRDTKSKPRHVPIWGEMRAYLEMAQAAAKSRYVIEWEGERVYEIKRSWKTACRLAGVQSSLFHDLRRTAATMMHDELGISREEIKMIVGWKTDAMFLRYHIGSEKHAQKLGRKMDEAMAQKSPASVQSGGAPRRTH